MDEDRRRAGHAPEAAPDKETGRVEAFSDGVFAIAITLLVLDLRLPGEGAAPSAAALWDQLTALGPSYAAFFISFAFSGIMWINHHRLFTHIQRVDTVLLLLNLLLLLGVTVLPFPTSVVATQFRAGGTPDAQRLATEVYSAVFFGIAIVFNLLWGYAATGNRLLSPQADRQAVARITRQYVFGPVLYLAALLVAFVSAPLSLLLSLLLAVFFALPGPPLPERPSAPER